MSLSHDSPQSPQRAGPFRSLPGAAAVLFAAFFVLTACGGSSGGSDAAATDRGDSAEAATAEPTAEDEVANAVADGSSPIDAMLGIPVMDEGEFNDYLIEVIAEGERRTAECMLAEGFEYTPETPSITGPSASENTDSREYAEQKGFGIIAAFEAAEFGPSTPVPPNTAYLATLTEGDRGAYEVALFGAPVADPEFEEGEDGGFPSAGTGCKALAIEQLGEVFAVMDEFGPVAEDIFDQWFSDPRMVESTETWGECMAEEGYIAPSRDEVRELVWPELEPLLNRDDLFVETADGAERYDGGSNWAEFLSGNVFSPHPALTTEGRELFDEVAEFERAVALASFDCYEPLREAELEIQREYELILVDTIGDEIGERLGDD